MKYLDKKFSSPANSKRFVDNWEAIFGEEEKPTQDPPPKARPEPDPVPASD